MEIFQNNYVDKLFDVEFRRGETNKLVAERIKKIVKLMPILSHAPELAAGFLVYYFSFNYDKIFSE